MMYEFYFDAYCEARNGLPVVAKLTYSHEYNKVRAEFYPMNIEFYTRKNIVFAHVFGYYAASDNDLIFMRYADDDYDEMNVYRVENGELLYVSDGINENIIDYLKNQSNENELDQLEP